MEGNHLAADNDITLALRAELVCGWWRRLWLGVVGCSLPALRRTGALLLCRSAHLCASSSTVTPSWWVDDSCGVLPLCVLAAMSLPRPCWQRAVLTVGARPGVQYGSYNPYRPLDNAANNLARMTFKGTLFSNPGRNKLLFEQHVCHRWAGGRWVELEGAH